DGTKGVMDLWPAVEDVVDLQLDLGPAKPRVLDRDFRDVAGVCEQAEVEGRERREMEIVAGQRIDPRPAPPIAAETRTDPVVEIARLRLDKMPRSAAALPLGVAMKVIDD